MNEFNGEIKKMMIILSKATLENVYAAFVLANGARMEGIEAEMFFTFFGLEAIHKEKLEHLHVATVGNPATPPAARARAPCSDPCSPCPEPHAASRANSPHPPPADDTPH